MTDPTADHPASLSNHEGVPVDSPPNQQYPQTREEFEYGMGSKEDLKSFIDEKLKHLSTSLTEEFKRVNTELLETVMAYQQSLQRVQEENANLIQSQNEILKTLNEYKKIATNQQRETENLRRENERMRREKEQHAMGSCQRQECVNAKRRVVELKRELELQTQQLNKVSVMKQFEQQHESKHDKLDSEYECLWTNVTIILEELEKHFEDRFYAKVFLSHIFMEGYKRSRKHLSELIMRYFDELFKVHPEEEWKSLENISRVYGLLLYSSQARTEAVQTKEVSQICHEIKRNLPPASELGAKDTLKTMDLPLERVVEVGWKFVTQPCPVIVELPARFNADLHDTYAKHWEEETDSVALTYAKPVVYRSYHGIVFNRGLVGNK